MPEDVRDLRGQVGRDVARAGLGAVHDARHHDVSDAAGIGNRVLVAVARIVDASALGHCLSPLLEPFHRQVAQAAALAQAMPGKPYEAGHDAAVHILTEGLLRLGLLKGKLEKNLAEGTYRRFYRHKTGHWLGLDVHDVGDYRIGGEYRLLEPGMVLTIEPGLYIPAGSACDEKWWDLAVRIEDDLLVIKEGVFELER